MAQLKTFTLQEVEYLMQKAAKKSMALTQSSVLSTNNRVSPAAKKSIMERATDDMLLEYKEEYRFDNKHDNSVWK